MSEKLNIKAKVKISKYNDNDKIPFEVVNDEFILGKDELKKLIGGDSNEYDRSRK